MVSTKSRMLVVLSATIVAVGLLVAAAPADAGVRRIPEPRRYTARALCCQILTGGPSSELVRTAPLPPAVYRLHIEVYASLDRPAVIVCGSGGVSASSTAGSGRQALSATGYVMLWKDGETLAVRCRLAGRGARASVLAAGLSAEPVAPARGFDLTPPLPGIDQAKTAP